MKSVVIIQARTSSNRLPAKILLPINGVPVAVLAAKRAANKGARILVVTSNNKSDDNFCRILDKNEIPYFRGSLLNTLSRFVLALNKYQDEKIVIRLTADNVFPDGDLLLELEKFYIENNLKYLICNGKESGLPYGVSAEITNLGLLREALKFSKEKEDFEHVTSYIRRKYGKHYFLKYPNDEFAGYRCTIDTLDDYLLVCNVFKEINNPITVSLQNLLHRLKEVQPYKDVNKLIIGGAQFGDKYGITNKAGKVPITTITNILKTAIRYGVDTLDTAQAYGDSEKNIGNSLENISITSSLKIVTKLTPLIEFPKFNNENAISIIESSIKSKVFSSICKLKLNSIYCMMLHRASFLNVANGIVFNTLLSMKHDGIIKHLGVSVNSPIELEQALSHNEIEFIQLPFNLLDWRWDKFIPIIKNIKKTRELTIHARSVFLQGLLLTQDNNLWKQANVENTTEIFEWMSERKNKLHLKSITELCATFVISNDWLDGVIFGMENINQLKENLGFFNVPRLSLKEIREIVDSRPKLKINTLNPSKWN